MPFAASALPMMSTTRPTSAMSAGSATRTPTSANRGDLVALREEREGVSVVFTAISVPELWCADSLRAQREIACPTASSQLADSLLQR